MVRQLPGPYPQLMAARQALSSGLRGHASVASFRARSLGLLDAAIQQAGQAVLALDACVTAGARLPEGAWGERQGLHHLARLWLHRNSTMRRVRREASTGQCLLADWPDYLRRQLCRSTATPAELAAISRCDKPTLAMRLYYPGVDMHALLAAVAPPQTLWLGACWL